jgi:ABC-2 type transport system permease protein
MKLNKSELTGTGEVFSFTLRQYFKSRGNLITNIILLVVVLLSMPVLTYLSNTGRVSLEGNAFEDTSSVETLMLYNQTDLTLDPTVLGQSTYWKDTQIKTVGDDHGVPGKHDALVVVTGDGADYQVQATTQDVQTDLSSYDLSTAADAVKGLVNSALEAQSAALTDEQKEILAATVQVQAGEPTAQGEESQTNIGERFAVQYGYAIIVLILCMTSSAFIIRAILEEKSSKLVELLLISVKPLALLVGKILAVMTHTFVFIVAMIACFAISSGIASVMMGGAVVSSVMTKFTTMMPAVSLDVGHLLGLIAVILISLLLAYLTVSLLSGVSGASCSNIEQMNSAHGTVTTLVLIGYLVSCVTCAIDNQAVAIASSLVPVVSVFCAPVRYVMGNISIWILLLSWVIQAAVVVFLTVFAARVYSALIMYKGERIKGKQLRAMAGFGKKEAV